jgi:hypothetical protein
LMVIAVLFVVGLAIEISPIYFCASERFRSSVRSNH